MAAPLIWSLLPAAVSIGAQVINRPRRSQFQPQTDYLERYVNDLRGRISRGDARHAALQPMLRQIGAQTRQTRRDVEQTIARGGLSGTGVAGALRLQAGQQATQAAERAGERAAAFQQQQTNRLQQGIDQSTLQIGQLEAQGQQQFQQAQQQWRQNLGQTVVSGVSSVAGAAMNQFQQQQQALNAAKAAGVVDLQTTPGEFRDMVAESGINDPTQYVRYLGNQANEEQQQMIEQQLQQGLDLTPEQRTTFEALPMEQQQRFAGEQLETQLDARGDIEERINVLQRDFSPEARQRVFQRTGLSEEFPTLESAIQQGAADPDLIQSALSQAQRGIEVERVAAESNLDREQQSLALQFIEENPQATTTEIAQTLVDAGVSFPDASVFARDVAGQAAGPPPAYYQQLEAVENASEASALGRRFNRTSDQAINDLFDVRRLQQGQMDAREQFEWFNERLFDRYSNFTGEQVEATPAQILQLGQTFPFISDEAIKQAIRTYADNPEQAEAFIERQFSAPQSDDPLNLRR